MSDLCSSFPFDFFRFWDYEDNKTGKILPRLLLDKSGQNNGIFVKMEIEAHTKTCRRINRKTPSASISEIVTVL